MADAIRLDRAYLPDGSATFGLMTLPCGWSCCVLENPWRNNERKLSCIPEGVYEMRMRRSPVVERTSGGEFQKGWEVTNVRDRTFIMLHPGNYERNTEGCLLPGRDFAWHEREGPMVTHSQVTFRRLMQLLSVRNRWDIDIRSTSAGYP
ncbi:MAG: DUF5675 family protein [Ectothiorhodospiraceae bacterium]|nr:DUF5675 family protein [Ectothiorhodospiraceae bacterium]